MKLHAGLTRRRKFHEIHVLHASPTTTQALEHCGEDARRISDTAPRPHEASPLRLDSNNAPPKLAWQPDLKTANAGADHGVISSNMTIVF
jgi:hypothetical protein